MLSFFVAPAPRLVLESSDTNFTTDLSSEYHWNLQEFAHNRWRVYFSRRSRRSALNDWTPLVTHPLSWSIDSLGLRLPALQDMHEHVQLSVLRDVCTHSHFLQEIFRRVTSLLFFSISEAHVHAHMWTYLCAFSVCVLFCFLIVFYYYIINVHRHAHVDLLVCFQCLCFVLFGFGFFLVFFLFFFGLFFSFSFHVRARHLISYSFTDFYLFSHSGE